MEASGKNGGGSLLNKIGAPIVLALAVGSTSPWWWSKLFPRVDVGEEPAHENDEWAVWSRTVSRTWIVDYEYRITIWMGTEPVVCMASSQDKTFLRASIMDADISVSATAPGIANVVTGREAKRYPCEVHWRAAGVPR